MQDFKIATRNLGCFEEKQEKLQLFHFQIVEKNSRNPKVSFYNISSETSYIFLSNIFFQFISLIFSKKIPPNWIYNSDSIFTIQNSKYTLGQKSNFCAKIHFSWQFAFLAIWILPPKLHISNKKNLNYCSKIKILTNECYKEMKILFLKFCW